MLDILACSSDILVIRVEGKLTTKDYEEIFIPRLESMLNGEKKVSIIIDFDDNFEGWEIGAMWDDVKFGLAHKNDFKKIATLNASEWMEWAMKISSYIFCDMQNFPKGDLQSAYEWVES